MNLRYIDLDENLLTRGSDGTYYRLRIGQDDWIDSPRDWSPLGHMLCWNRRYNLGDKHDYSEPIDFWHDMVREHIDRNTLFAYALSGDGSVRLQKEIDEYIHGDVYWYRLEKFLGGTVAGEEVSPQEALYADIFWEEIDSCGGFYGSDVTENGMTEHWPEMEEVA